MVASTLFNVFFDLGFIFGHFGLPRMGIAGAALATIISQAIALASALFLLNHKIRLMVFSAATVKEILTTWLKTLKFGLPGALGLMLNPLAAGIITKLVAGYGNAAVAASGVAGRIEMFAFMIPMTVGMSLMPFIAQNYGAGRMDRIRAARKGTMLFAALYGIFIALLFVIFAGPMARLFSDEKAVIDVLKAYIYITCAGYGMLEVHRYSGFCMTGTHEPLRASFLNIIRIGILLVPLSLLGGALFQLNGIFLGRLLTDLTAGSIGNWWSARMLAKK
jgi:Na+-driven multidrug efflux pump